MVDSNRGGYSFNKIRQYSFIVEYVYLAFLCIIIIKRFEPHGMEFNLYMPLLVDISAAFLYYIILFYCSGKEKEPTKLELFLRMLYLFAAGNLLAETNNAAVNIIIIMPTVIMALRYPLKYTVIVASITTFVLLYNFRYLDYEFDYFIVFISFIWMIGLLVNASMEVERQVQEERLKLQEKEKLAAVGQMAAGIAHEVRNPLTTIKGFVQLLNRSHVINNPVVLNDYMEMINKEIIRVDNLLSDFLQFAKPNKPQLVMSDINRTIEELRVLIEAQCMNKGIEFVLHLLSGLPLIRCDYNQIKQVIVNICINAVDAMHGCETRILTLQTDYDTKYIYISISDTGAGMTQEQMIRIFNPFYTTKENGTGLGLSVCYSIIENHSGKIHVESEPDQGTRFLISLPR